MKLPDLSTGRASDRGVNLTAAVVVSALVGVVAFAFRVLPEKQLANDHYMHMAWAQQVLLGDLPGRDFVDPGMPLAYLLSAAAQYAVPGPLSEVVLSSAMLALAAAVTCLLVARLSGSLLWGLAAALFEVALQPRFYSFPKILVPAVTLTAIAWHCGRPSRRRVVVLAIWTVTAGLLRYDLGVYSVSAIGVGLLVFSGREWRNGLRSVSSYAAMLLIVALPYLTYIQATEGLATHVRGGLEFSKADQHQFLLELPRFPVGMMTAGPLQWNATDAATALAYVVRLLMAATLLVALVRLRHMRPERRGIVAAALVFLTWYAFVILRHPLPARVPDLAAVLALVGAWTGAEALHIVRPLVAQRRAVPALVGVTLAIVLACGGTLAAGSAWALGDVSSQIRETRVMDGWAKVREVLAERANDGTVWPWRWYWPAGAMPEAVRYISACTAPTDRLLVTWRASEYYFFTRRAFAGGHSQLLAPVAFTGTRDQELMIERLARYAVPVVLINETSRRELVNAYPLLDSYLRQHYSPTGQFTIRDGSQITIAVDNAMSAIGSYGPERWPCGFSRPPTPIS